MTIAGAQQRSLQEKLGLLRETDLFAGLSDDDIMAIGHATTMTHCSAGQRIMSPDDPPDRIHILKKGKVRVYRVTPDGKQLTLDIYDKGTILGDMSLLGQEPIPEAFAETLDEAVDLHHLARGDAQAGGALPDHRREHHQLSLAATPGRRVGTRVDGIPARRANTCPAVARRAGMPSSTRVPTLRPESPREIADDVHTNGLVALHQLAHLLGRDGVDHGLIDVFGEGLGDGLLAQQAHVTEDGAPVVECLA